MKRHPAINGIKVLLGITGGIGAYKSAELIRLFMKQGAEVSVVMTRNATQFITPLTVETLSRNPVGTDLFSLSEERSIDHISRARWADLMVIAPATANYLAKAAHGIADDLLTTISLAATCPVLIAPAMNSAMWDHVTVRSNLEILTSRGVAVVPPTEGELACGEEGVGRMADPEQIVAAAAAAIQLHDLDGVRVLVTAGPTREAVDPVRFLSNRSSGKMGYALAEAAATRGAEVILVSGPAALDPPSGVTLVSVESAREMLAAVRANLKACQWVIMAAAVADFRPSAVLESKLKKKGRQGLSLDLTANPDILKTIAADKGNRLYIGFAAETEDLLENARAKLEGKGLDLIVGNDVTERGSGFGSETNQAVIILRDGTVERLPLMTKRELADQILDQSMRCWQSGDVDG
ncbi:MAG: bifunctional phosphopantothenoylcysteine decarboxylase/phosphopantothenate--cysteine ligase CoaBC [bacterium]|nr:MAG: bifunctional phosphopantothenoylcysteine decarboxylase/phosphopantothenate--cysteine ligase CoaBC [bacterium]